MALRIALALALTAFSALAGRALAGVPLKRAALIRQLMDDLQILRSSTLERLMPLTSALIELKSPCFTLLARKLGEPGVGGVIAAWEKLKSQEHRRSGALDGLEAEDIEPLDALFAALNVTGRRSHEALYAQAMERLGRREAESRRLGSEKLKLHTSLGALAGLAVSVLLI